MTPAELEEWLTHPPGRRPLVVGILNVTPDSFSDGGRYLHSAAAVARAEQLIDEGADWIDIGGESTRPGSEPVAPAVQIERVVPVIKAAAGRNVVLSIDTTSAGVARAALEAGASVINDVSAGCDDPEMPDAMARARAVVLMHMQGRPRTMQARPTYKDVVAEVEAYLLSRAGAVEGAGVARWRIVLDPGIGFGKTLRHNLELLRALSRLPRHGYPVLVGTSRKGFIGSITGEPMAEQRQMGTAATVAWCVANGAALVRVHEVRKMRQVVQTTRAILDPAWAESATRE